LVCGKPASGKSHSLKGLANHERCLYINCDLKTLPFKNKFKFFKMDDPLKIFDLIEKAESSPNIDVIVLDTITFLMDMYEMQYVLTSKNTQTAWGSYAQYFKKLMYKLKTGTKNYIILAHIKDVFNDSENIIESKVPVKGSVGATGVEADFNTIVYSKRILDKNSIKGFRYVFQTQITKENIYEKIRGASDLWEEEELYIENNVQIVLDRLQKYYEGE